MTKKEKENKEFKTWRASEELKIVLFKTIDSFSSIEEPKLNLSSKDKVLVLIEVAKSYLLRVKTKP